MNDEALKVVINRLEVMVQAVQNKGLTEDVRTERIQQASKDFERRLSDYAGFDTGDGLEFPEGIRDQSLSETTGIPEHFLYQLARDKLNGAAIRLHWHGDDPEVDALVDEVTEFLAGQKAKYGIEII